MGQIAIALIALDLRGMGPILAAATVQEKRALLRKRRGKTFTLKEMKKFYGEVMMRIAEHPRLRPHTKRKSRREDRPTLH